MTIEPGRLHGWGQDAPRAGPGTSPATSVREQACGEAQDRLLRDLPARAAPPVSTQVLHGGPGGNARQHRRCRRRPASQGHQPSQALCHRETARLQMTVGAGSAGACRRYAQDP